MKITLPVKDFNGMMLLTDHPRKGEASSMPPLTNTAGKMFTELLCVAGIVREQCLIASVLPYHVKDDSVLSICTKKKEADAAWTLQNNAGKYPFEPIKQGNYLPLSVLAEFRLVHNLILKHRPNLIVTLGALPYYCLSGSGKFTKRRGTVVSSTIGDTEFKVLPTHHPEILLTKFADRTVLYADMTKAAREAAYPEIRRRNRRIVIEPTLEEIRHVLTVFKVSGQRFALDIETAQGEITCIGFGTPDRAICIPFRDTRKPNWSYWSTLEDEAEAWRLVRAFLTLPNPKVLQNGMYDMTWLFTKLGLFPHGDLHDPMLLHHAMYPEMQKGLAFLGSLYTNEAAWKSDRPKHLNTQKKDDEE